MVWWWWLVGLCCDCCSAGWGCLIADWTLGSGVRFGGLLEQTFDEGTFLSRLLVK